MTPLEKQLDTHAPEHTLYGSDGRYWTLDDVKRIVTSVYASRDAEVEELKKQIKYLVEDKPDYGNEFVAVIIAKTERDELREKVGDVARCLEDVLYAHLGGHLSPNETGKAVLDKLRKFVHREV